MLPVACDSFLISSVRPAPCATVSPVTEAAASECLTPEDWGSLAYSQIVAAGCLRLVENFQDADLPGSSRHQPMHRVPSPVAKDGGADRSKNRNLALLNIRIGWKHECIISFLACLHILEANTRVHGDHAIRNRDGLHDMGSVQLILQTLQVVAISLHKADAHLQEFFQTGVVEPGDVYVSRFHVDAPLFMTLPSLA